MWHRNKHFTHISGAERRSRREGTVQMLLIICTCILWFLGFQLSGDNLGLSPQGERGRDGADGRKGEPVSHPAAQSFSAVEQYLTYFPARNHEEQT